VEAGVGTPSSRQAGSTLLGFLVREHGAGCVRSLDADDSQRCLPGRSGLEASSDSVARSPRHLLLVGLSSSFGSVVRPSFELRT